MDDFRKSINAILYERLVSPFYGTLLISWLIWNWKIMLTVLFGTEKSGLTRIEFITTECNSNLNLYWGPIISTIVIIAIMPVVANGAFWLTLQYDGWKARQKENKENQKRLTVQQSMQLRKEIIEQESRLGVVLSAKDTEIENLKKIIEENNADKMKLRIVKAWYGIDDSKIDVTDYLNRKIESNSLKVLINNDLFESQDPKPGSKKTLEVIFEQNQNISHRKLEEGQTLEIMNWA